MSLIKILDTNHDDVVAVLRQRRASVSADIQASVAETIEDVRQRGDAALLESAQKFDAPTLKSVLATDAELAEASIPPAELEAIEVAITRVTQFHTSQLLALTEGMSIEPGRSGFRWVREQSNGGFVGQRMVPIARAGIYVPGGQASYPSSVVMNTVPSVVAGVRDRVLCTPAREDGSLHPAVLVAARECGIGRVAKVGGAAAVAAMAFGTESIPRADVIAGPGNKYVNEAKRQLWGQVGLDGYAGPSEVAVLIDEIANPAFVAADLLTQIEHAEDNQAFIVGTSADIVHAVIAEMEVQLESAPRRAILRKALGDGSLAIIARDLGEAAELIDLIAPEHLTVDIEDPDRVLPAIQNAGCILMGDWTPESAGDYILGPSHTLPTMTAARFASPVNVLTFVKLQSLSRLTPSSLMPLVRSIETFAQMEGLPTHGEGASIRQRTFQRPEK
jgi:histidinol dehydrogenase